MDILDLYEFVEALYYKVTVTEQAFIIMPGLT